MHYALSLLFMAWIFFPSQGFSERPVKDQGAGRVYVYGELAEFDGTFGSTALSAYLDRLKKKYPEAQFEPISPFTKEKLAEVYRGIENSASRNIHVFLHTHGLYKNGEYLVTMDHKDADSVRFGQIGQQEVVDGEMLGALKVPANYYLMTCHSGGAHLDNCFPLAKQIFFSSPSHRPTGNFAIASIYAPFSSLDEPLPGSPFELWRRAEENNMEGFLHQVKEIDSIALPHPTGCIVGGKMYGGVCEESYEKYKQERLEEARRRSGRQHVELIDYDSPSSFETPTH